jgi:hypothetical protein
METATQRWNSGQFPSEPGEHPSLPIFVQSPVLIDNGYGNLVEVQLTVTLVVRRELFLGQLPIERIRGLKDELS